MAQAVFEQDGKTIDYTPSAAVAAGAVVVQCGLVGIATRPIPAHTLGALAVRGVFRVVKAQEAITAGAAVYWDADGTPVGGPAGSGAATTTSAGNTYMGRAVAAAAEPDKTVDVLL